MNFSLFAVFYVPGMVLDDFTSQHVTVNMRVNFCCCDGLMSQHALYGAQVCAAFQQVGGKRMAKGVRTDIFGDSRLFCEFLDEVEYHDA